MRSRKALMACVVLSVASMAAGCAQGDSSFFGADEHRAAMEEARSEIPLPPGATWPERQVNDGDQYEVGLARTNIEYNALCAWQRYWLEVRDTDPAQAERAWEFMESMRRSDLYQGADTRWRDRFDEMLEQAELGDPSAIARHVEVACGS